jgi:hypothetical protein
VVRQVSIEVRHLPPQRIHRVVNTKRIRDHPKAKLPAFESSLAEGNSDLEQIGLGFVKETKMRAEGYIADEVSSCIPPRSVHGRWLPISRLWHAPDATALAADEEGMSRREKSAEATACAEISTGPMALPRPASRIPYY